MPRWRIYYEDGTSFDSDQGGPGDAPAMGVLSIQQRAHCAHHPVEWMKAETTLNTAMPVQMLEAANYYWWRDDTASWYRGDLMGFMDQAAHCGARWLKVGRCADHATWERTMMRVQQDPDFQP